MANSIMFVAAVAAIGFTITSLKPSEAYFNSGSSYISNSKSDFTITKKRIMNVQSQAVIEKPKTCAGMLTWMIDRKLLDDSVKYSHIGAIMITESGVKGASTPHQYTFNFGGEAQRFNDKTLALKFLSSRNDKNVDVGCMQINLWAHCKEYMGSCTKKARLQMAEKLFDKEENIRFAFVLIKRAAAKGKLGYYHSATKDKYTKYVGKVNDVLASAGLDRNFK